MKKTKVVCIGEALIDRIKNKSNQEFTDFLGGAPANVAFSPKLTGFSVTGASPTAAVCSKSLSTIPNSLKNSGPLVAAI